MNILYKKHLFCQKLIPLKSNFIFFFKGYKLYLKSSCKETLSTLQTGYLNNILFFILPYLKLL